MGDGSPQRFGIVAGMVSMSITTLVMGIVTKQCVNAEGWCLDPEMRLKPLAFPVGAVAAGAATAVHLSVHAAHFILVAKVRCGA